MWLCCGSGSVNQIYGSGSGSGSFYHQAKIVRKILISTVLWLVDEFLSLKTDENVPSIRNKKKLIFCWHLESHWRKEQDPNPDPYVSVTDPRIRIRNKKRLWSITLDARPAKDEFWCRRLFSMCMFHVIVIEFHVSVIVFHGTRTGKEDNTYFYCRLNLRHILGCCSPIWVHSKGIRQTRLRGMGRGTQFQRRDRHSITLFVL